MTIALVVALTLSLAGIATAHPSGPFPGPAGAARDADAHVRLVQHIEPIELGLVRTSAVTFAPDRGVLLINGRDSTGASVVVASTTLGVVTSSTVVPQSVAESAGLAYDATTDTLVATPMGDELVAVDAPDGTLPAKPAVTGGRITGDDVGTPAGLAVHTDGSTRVLEADGRVLELSGSGVDRSVVRSVDLSAANEPLSGLAAAPDARLLSAATTGDTIYEFSDAGALLATRDIADAGISQPQGMVMAPSADPTDAPERLSLYIADGSDGASAGIYEFELVATPLAASVLATPNDAAALVSTIEGSALTPNSPDPSGITYDATSDRLVMTDGEIEEEKNNSYPYPGTNGWVFPRDGSGTTSVFDTTDDECSADGGSPNNREPVGIARNPDDGHYFIARDGRNLVWELDAGFSPLRCLALSPLGVADSEGIAYGNGRLWIADGTGAEIWEIGPGPNGVFGIDLASSGPNDDVVLGHFDTASLGQPDAEGVEFDHVSGTLYLVSNDEGSEILEVSTSGSPLRTIQVSGVVLDAPRGLGLAPGTDGSTQNLWIADARVDNNNNAGAIDGRIYEFALGSPPPPPPPGAPDTTITSGPSGTTSSTDASFTFTGTAGTDSFECQLDLAGFSACTSPQDYSGLALGDHTFEVRAVAAGVPDPTPASRTWTIDSSPPPPPGDNLLLNPGFELADPANHPTDWEVEPAFSRSTGSVHGGSYAGLHQSTTSAGYNVYQTVAVSAGSDYTVDGWVDVGSQGDSGFKFQIKLQWRNASGKISTVKLAELTGPTAGWTQLTATDTAPAGATEVRVLMVLRNLDGSVYVDDFAFAPTP
ncbi:MAG: hypothetical protein ACR2K4_10670 [Candidatus Limnocylindria bacterium]